MANEAGQKRRAFRKNTGHTYCRLSKHSYITLGELVSFMSENVEDLCTRPRLQVHRQVGFVSFHDSIESHVEEFLPELSIRCRDCKTQLDFLGTYEIEQGLTTPSVLHKNRNPKLVPLCPVCVAENSSFFSPPSDHDVVCH